MTKGFTFTIGPLVEVLWRRWGCEDLPKGCYQDLHIKTSGWVEYRSHLILWLQALPPHYPALPSAIPCSHFMAPACPTTRPMGPAPGAYDGSLLKIWPVIKVYGPLHDLDMILGFNNHKTVQLRYFAHYVSLVGSKVKLGSSIVGVWTSSPFVLRSSWILSLTILTPENKKGKKNFLFGDAAMATAHWNEIMLLMIWMIWNFHCCQCSFVVRKKHKSSQNQDWNLYFARTKVRFTRGARTECLLF